MAVKMNLRIITKNNAADPEKGFLAKSISKSNGYATAMPTAWELNNEIFGYELTKVMDFFKMLFHFLDQWVCLIIMIPML